MCDCRVRHSESSSLWRVHVPQMVLKGHQLTSPTTWHSKARLAWEWWCCVSEGSQCNWKTSTEGTVISNVNVRTRFVRLSETELPQTKKDWTFQCIKGQHNARERNKPFQCNVLTRKASPHKIWKVSVSGAILSLSSQIKWNDWLGWGGGGIEWGRLKKTYVHIYTDM